MNPAYLEFAQHYSLAVIPARPRKPKDKPVAESAVQVAGRWILARLRNTKFFSLDELNTAISKLLVEMNAREFQKRPGSRHSMFQELDAPVLKPLPERAYRYAQWKKVRAHMDYHVSIDGHHYSVPHQLVKTQLDARITSVSIEIFHQGKRVTSHTRTHRAYGHTTLREHMPSAHQHVAGMSEKKLHSWAESVGLETLAFIKELIKRRTHPQQAFRSCAGILGLADKHSKERLEQACRRARKLGSYTYQSVKTMLEKNLEGQPLTSSTSRTPIKHDNVRGSNYYKN